MLRQINREFEVSAGDGTPLRAWENNVVEARPTVLLCPGLGSMPRAWPNLLDSEAAARVVGWYHRTSFAAGLTDHVEDAVAVLDTMGVKRCTVVGWSVGAAVATELARRYPERVCGLMLVGGVPGTGLDALLEDLHVPDLVRRLLAAGGSQSLQVVGPLLEPVLRLLPANEVSARLLQHSGLMLPGGDPAAVAVAMQRFLQHDWLWYVSLALALGPTARVKLTGIDCPVTVVAGRYDVLSDVRSITSAAATLPQARMRILPTSHFTPLEAPEDLEGELALLLQRVETVECARLGLDPPPRRVRRARWRVPEVGRPRRPVPYPGG